MLEIKNLSFSYDKNKPILENINAVFERGMVVAMQGESGQGKTTLLSILAGLEKEYQGDVYFDSNKINKSDIHEYNKKHVSMIFQEHNLIHYLTLNDNIKQGCAIKNKKLNQDKQKEYIDSFNLQSLSLNQYPSKLSGGQQQRIAIIRALLSDTSIILADEPTASIDRKNATAVISTLKELAKKENKIVMIVTHSNRVAKECDVVYLMKDKTLVKIS